ncbi:cytochrome b [Aeropyrum pernix K1]|uniref:Cytochrome b n=1 Tax=Aeropyrum pernix (strain ATCC 700893 / DSM 11879 / JCM 9820 / NBRC 100138 / K1) TaxID=272557 RepID=Q9YB72_AERPE|nr:cytochrome bc complex cytochrome b subunit [Aeropyrum pernix]BAA80726.1 cytochrome b [Aeropyrum pernix K1]
MAARMFVRKAWEWIYERGGLGHLPFYRVPYSYFTLDIWLGAIVASSFFWLALTGLLLLFYYRPTDPLESSKAIIFERPFGALLLTSHLYAAHFMLIGVFAHAFRNLFKGVYKRPRELVWIVGVATGFLALQTAFFGYSLVGDRIAKEAINIGSALNLRSLGEELGLYVVAILFGLDPTERYFRITALHVLLAATVFLLFLLHFGLFEVHGPAPKEEETGWKAEPARIPQDRSDLAPWFPVNLVFILAVTLMTWGFIVFTAGMAQRFADLLPPLFKPYPVEAEDFTPMPPWFFLYTYRIFQMTFLTLSLESTPQLLQFIIALVLPPLILMIIPFVDRKVSTNPVDRPWITGLGIILLTGYMQLTVWSMIEPGIPIRLVQLLTVASPPLAATIVGLYLLRKVRRGEAITPGDFLSSSGLLVAGTALPPLLGMALGVPELHQEVAVGFMGLAFATVILGWIAAKLRVEPESELEPVQDPDSSIPWYLLLVALGEVGIASFSLIALAAIAFIDPVGYAMQATVLTGLLLLSGGALAHALFRALAAEWIPRGNVVDELKVHFLPYLALALAVIFVL